MGDLSVLNTDRFDRRRFGQIYDMSKSLKKMERHEEIPLFKELLGDIWASLYKVSPKIKEELSDPQLAVNKAIIEKLMSDEQYINYHETTQLDDLLSAVGTVNFGKQTAIWLEEMKKQNEAINDLINQINDLSNQMSKQNKNDFDDNEQENEGQDENQGNNNSENNENNQSDNNDGNGENDNTPQQQMNDLMNQLANQLTNAMNGNESMFSKKIQQAIKDTKESTDNLEKLFGDIGGKLAGSGSGTLQQMPLRNKLELSEVLANDKQLKEIANWAGKFTRIAKTKQKKKSEKGVGVGGIELGDNLEKVLPSELMFYANPVTRDEFFKKHSEKTLRQYKPRSKEKLGKGSIIVCLDQSGSMKSIEEQSKGFALAIMAIARKQKRDFAYIPFDATVNNIRVFPKGKIKPDELIEIAREFTGGGTEFEPPLKESLNIIKKDRFKDADIIFITDGYSNVRNYFLEEFMKIKKEKEFSVLSLVINERDTREVEKFSDRVVVVDRFDDENSYEIFEI